MLVAAGCQGKQNQLASVYITQKLVSSSMGGSLAITQADCDRDDRVCKYVGTSIVIPRGALPNDTEIRIGVGDDATGRNGTPIGPAIDFEPEGTTFASPVEITIPLTKEIEKDLLRVYVTEANGTQSVLMPYQLAYDRTNRTVRFLINHFTTFQCGEGHDDCSDVAGCPSGECANGQCTDACDPNECGPQPGIPSWTCEDGTTTGFTGQCVRQPDGSCGWEIIDCPDPCVVTCEPGANGDCRPVCNTDCGGVTCPPGSTCDPSTNSCVSECICPDGQPCAIDEAGTVFCGGGTCDATSCPPGSRCDENTGNCIEDCVCPNGQACEIAPDGTFDCGVETCGAGVACPEGTRCDPATGTCIGECTCPDGQPCAVDQNGGVWCGGMGCTDPNGCPPGSRCDENTGNCVSDCVCPDGQTCVQDENGVVSCDGSNECEDPSLCGPAPGVPNWTCEDGSTGGPTGRCLANADGTCGWEIIWCPMGCDPSACEGQPPPTDPNVVCDDGTVPPYVCRHDSAGANTCSWQQSCSP
jgi:hypothetical protein